MEDFRIYVTINDEDIKRHNKDIIKVVIVTACIAIFFGVINAFLPEDESVKTVAGVKGLLISSLLLCGICSISAFDFAKKNKGTHWESKEYFFRNDGLRISDRHSFRIIPRNELSRCVEMAYGIKIFTSRNNESFYIPKRVLTVSEVENILRYFKKEPDKDKFSDNAICGERCEGIDFSDESCIFEKKFSPEKKYINKNMEASKRKDFLFVVVLFVALMILCMLVIGNLVASIIFSSIFTIKVGISCMSSASKKSAEYQVQMSVVFRESCYELTFNNITDRVFYNEIIGLKVYDGAIGVTSYKNEVFLPKDEEMLRILESKVYAKH